MRHLIKVSRLCCCFLLAVTTVFCSASKLSASNSVILKNGDLTVSSTQSNLIWDIKIADKHYRLSLYPGEKTKSVSVENLRNKNASTLVSAPAFRNDTEFITESRVVAAKDFPGVMFVVKKMNVGKNTAPTDIECYLSMKETRYFDYRGEKTCGLPRRKKTGMSNWVFLPDGKKGLALIMNFNIKDGKFISTYGRGGRDGKRINSVARSTWGIRRNGVLTKTGDSIELRFGLVPADSPEKAAEYCNLIKEKKIFPSLKLRNLDDSYKTNKPEILKPLKPVEPVTDAKYYSAGNSPAAEIDEAIKSEIKPEEFDIWYDKKERIYLNGSWKLLKLANTLERPNCDYGLKHGFDKADFDDFKWFNQPVPFNWYASWRNFFAENDKMITGLVGVGWYRKSFNIPENYKDKRILLHFQGVDQKAVVYVNGVKVASNKTIMLESTVNHHHTTYDAFEADVTDLVHFGENNSLAVRVYDDGDTTRHNRKRFPGIGGIWQEVYLDICPDIYLKEALITSNVKKSSIDVGATIINSSKEDKTRQLSLWLGAWQSKRYKSADWQPVDVKLETYTLKPGENKIKFTAIIDQPHLWSPEFPQLYHMKLMDSKGVVLGQARFGFREFITGEDYFYLNGAKLLMRGEQTVIDSWSQCPGYAVLDRQMGILNRRNALGKYLDMYKGLNYNVMRTHATFHPHSFNDLCDEKGVLTCIGHHFTWNEPFFDTEGKITSFYREKIEKIAKEIYKYPSVVLLSMRNEPFDNHLIGTKHESWQPAIDQVYDEFKKHIKHVPLACAGRPPTRKASEKYKFTGHYPSVHYAKTDFYAPHNYAPCFRGLPQAEEDECNYSMKFLRDAFMFDGGPKVMLATEANISGLNASYSQGATQLEKLFKPHIKNGKIDRKFLVDEWQYISRFNTGARALNRVVCKFGFLNVTSPPETRMKFQAIWTKRLHELSRRQRKDAAGILSNNSMNFTRSSFNKEMDSYYIQPVADATKKANQPVLACFDFKWNRNLFSGKNDEDLVYIINDHENSISNVLVDISLVAPNNQSYKLGTFTLDQIGTGDMAVKPFIFNVPSDIPTEHYQMNLRVTYDCKQIGKSLKSVNDYDCFVMNRNDIKLKNASSEKVALLVADSDKVTEKMFADLNLKFDRIKEFNNLSNYKTLIMGPDSYWRSDGDSLLTNWLNNGGNLICFSQKILPEAFGHELKPAGRFGYFSELIEWDHPVFDGLQQEDFRLWNAKRGKIADKWLFQYAITPLDMGMLSTQQLYSSRMSMTSAAYCLGKGKMILSQFDSVKRFNYDSVATKLILNILNWSFGGFKGLEAPLVAKVQKVVFNVSEDKVDFVDISKQCDMGFKDEKAHDGKGGWTDQGPEFDLRNIPTGKQIFNGVPFNIIDPKQNNDKSCIVLQGPLKSKTSFLPEKVKIPINVEYKKLYFLISCAWTPKDAVDIANLRVVAEAKGIEMATVFDIKLKKQFNLADWWNPSSHKPPYAELGWCGPLRDQNREVGTYIIEWTNPLYGMNLKLQHVTFESYKQAVPVLLAITGEK